MPSCSSVYRNWKDNAKPGETKDHYDMRMNRNHRKALRKARRG